MSDDAHTRTGNCWRYAHDCGECGPDVLCDVCHGHDEPRGDCSECEHCPACDAHDADVRIQAELAIGRLAWGRRP